MCDVDLEGIEDAGKEGKRLIKLVTYISHCLELTVPEWVGKLTTDDFYYYEARGLRQLTQHLCDICSKMTRVQKNVYIFDGHNRDARRLADWWDDHQEADKKREIAA